MIMGEGLLTRDDVRALPLRERVGLVINTAASVKSALSAIIEAERAGVRQVWTTQGPAAMDALGIYTIAAGLTTAIRMGTSILPTYPRHPLTVAAQARTILELAPGRLRLGLGTSHRPTIEGMYGIAMVDPLEYLREYVTVLRSALWEGKVEHQGRFFQVNAALPVAGPVPLLISALGKNAFRAAGEVSDGALSWVCPVSYLLGSAVPALEAGARQAGRNVPPLVAHVPVAHHADREAVLIAARKRLGHYGKLPFYRNMFAEAGYPVSEDGWMPDSPLEALVVSGDEQTIAARLTSLLNGGMDELNLLIVGVDDEAQEWSRLAQLIGQL